MKRVYHKSVKSAAQKRAMEQYLETREKIRQDNPGLLSSMRERIAAQMRQPQQEQPQKPANVGEEKIDRRKNLQTVEKLLEITTASMGFQNRVKTLIAQAQI